MVNSRNKGKVGEREIVNILKDHGYDCRRSQQYCGYAEGGQADVIGLPHIHCEVKRVEKLNIDNAVSQACRDSKEGEIPTVFHRKNRKPWCVTMLLEDWIDLYKRAYD